VVEDVCTETIIGDHPERAIDVEVMRIASEIPTDPTTWTLWELF
jgi:hypothetical protein